MSRFGCSNTNGIPSTPSQKSIDVWRFAPLIVMWWTPWVWIFLMRRGPTVPPCTRLRQAPPRHELDACGDNEHGADSLTDRLGEVLVELDPVGELDGDGEGRLLLDACGLGPDADVAAQLGGATTTSRPPTGRR